MSTLVVYPDASSGGTTCDGQVYYNTAGQDFSQLVGASIGSGVYVNSGTGEFAMTRMSPSSFTLFTYLYRSIFNFDTSSLTAFSSISNAVFSLFGTSKIAQLGETPLHIVSTTPASNNNIVTSDYNKFGSITFGNVTYASFSTSAYSDITLNSSGISNISKTGVSKFGTRLGWDMNSSYSGGTPGFNYYTQFYGYMADNSGTTNDPKLTITYTLNLKNINGLSSIKTKNLLLKDSIKTFNGLS